MKVELMEELKCESYLPFLVTIEMLDYLMERMNILGY